MATLARTALFPALLKHWRARRGLSQLDLALAAGVSARHISFLETARSTPSAAMVLRLAGVLDVPLRETNGMLEAAGHTPAFANDEAMPSAVRDALELMKKHHEPYPLVVVDRAYDVLDANQAALRLLRNAIADASPPWNLAHLTFDPNGAQSSIVNFDEVGPALLWRLQREVLGAPENKRLAEVLTQVLALPTIDPEWRNVDFGVPSLPALVIHLRIGETDLRFIVALTVFQSPQSLAADEVRIESWLPADDASAAACRALALADGT